MSDSKKDLLEGGAAIGAALAFAGAGPAGVLAITIPTLVNVGVNAIRAADQKRAHKLFERMIIADEDAAEFIEGLNSRLATDPDVVAAFRALMVAAVESVALGALEPMAFVGRQYLRGTCPAWIARGWLRILTELGERELAVLRSIVHEAVRRRAIITEEREKAAQESHRGPPSRSPVRLKIERNLHGPSSMRVSFGSTPTGLFQKPSPDFKDEFVDRLWQLLTQNHLGRLMPDAEQLKREWKAEENRAKTRAEAEAKRGRSGRESVQYSMFDEPREQTELFQFDDLAFEVIAQGLPLPISKPPR